MSSSTIAPRRATDQDVRTYPVSKGTPAGTIIWPGPPAEWPAPVAATVAQGSGHEDFEHYGGFLLGESCPSTAAHNRLIAAWNATLGVPVEVLTPYLLGEIAMLLSYLRTVLTHGGGPRIRAQAVEKIDALLQLLTIPVEGTITVTKAGQTVTETL